MKLPKIIYVIEREYGNPYLSGHLNPYQAACDKASEVTERERHTNTRKRGSVPADPLTLLKGNRSAVVGTYQLVQTTQVRTLLKGGKVPRA